MTVDNPLKAYTVDQLQYEIAMRQAAAVSQPEVLTAEAIEAGAQALVNDHWHPSQKLSSINRSEADRWRKQARLVLEAAMKSAPQVRTSQQAEMQPNGDTTGCGAGTVAQTVPDSYRDTVRQVGAVREKRMAEMRECLESIAGMRTDEPREPDDADWRFRCLSAVEAAKNTLAVPSADREGK